MNNAGDQSHFPWKRAVVSFFILILLAVVLQLTSDVVNSQLIPKTYQTTFTAGVAVVWVIIGFLLVNRMRHALMRFMYRNQRHASLWNLGINVLTGIGYLFVGVFCLRMLNTSMSSLLVSGAVTGVIVGIAAQSTLANLLAGLVIMTLRPFTLGQRITCRSWMFSGAEYTGVVEELNLFYTVLRDGELTRVIPNSAAVVAAVTVHSGEPEYGTYTLRLSYACSHAEAEEKLRELAGPEASLWVESFEEKAVVYRARIPASQTDALRLLVLWAEAVENVPEPDSPTATNPGGGER
ncbi:MAG: mechanosensitive ion channel family protein [Alicyclobacillaceae bacterium]|nr:mechanosensitive ion channel family protein [Alicyclobacillaceae bacterium]